MYVAKTVLSRASYRFRSAEYFVPMGLKSPAVYSLLPYEAASFHATTAETNWNPVNMKDLKTALDLLPESEVYKLYFPVPEHRFANFKKQLFEGEEGAGSKGRVNRVHQYKLRVVMRRAHAVRSVRIGLRAGHPSLASRF